MIITSDKAAVTSTGIAVTRTGATPGVSWASFVGGTFLIYLQTCFKIKVLFFKQTNKQQQQKIDCILKSPLCQKKNLKKK